MFDRQAAAEIRLNTPKPVHTHSQRAQPRVMRRPRREKPEPSESDGHQGSDDSATCIATGTLVEGLNRLHLMVDVHEEVL